MILRLRSFVSSLVEASCTPTVHMREHLNSPSKYLNYSSCIFFSKIEGDRRRQMVEVEQQSSWVLQSQLLTPDVADIDRPAQV